MFSADQVWNLVKRHIRPVARRQGQTQFRRLIREYLSYRQGGAYHPMTNRVSKKVKVGEFWKFTGGRRRRQQVMLAARPVGRPSAAAVDYLVTRLAHLWATWEQEPTTIRHKRYQREPTKWELFLCDVLGRLDIGDCRRYAEKHSRAKRG